MPQMKAPFYGHTRQYESIQKELDGAIRVVHAGDVFLI